MIVQGGTPQGTQEGEAAHLDIKWCAACHCWTKQTNAHKSTTQMTHAPHAHTHTPEGVPVPVSSEHCKPNNARAPEVTRTRAQCKRCITAAGIQDASCHDCTHTRHDLLMLVSCNLCQLQRIDEQS